jgi:hypothetical protein
MRQSREPTSQVRSRAGLDYSARAVRGSTAWLASLSFPTPGPCRLLVAADLPRTSNDHNSLVPSSHSHHPRATRSDGPQALTLIGQVSDRARSPAGGRRAGDGCRWWRYEGRSRLSEPCGTHGRVCAWHRWRGAGARCRKSPSSRPCSPWCVGVAQQPSSRSAPTAPARSSGSVAAASATVVSVDCRRLFGSGYTDEQLEVLRGYRLPGQSLHFLQAGSQKAASRDAVVSVLDGQHGEFLDPPEDWGVGQWGGTGVLVPS